MKKYKVEIIRVLTQVMTLSAASEREALDSGKVLADHEMNDMIANRQEMPRSYSITYEPYRPLGEGGDIMIGTTEELGE